LSLLNCSKFSITSCVAWSSWSDDKRGSRSFTAKFASFSDFSAFTASLNNSSSISAGLFSRTDDASSLSFIPHLQLSVFGIIWEILVSTMSSSTSLPIISISIIGFFLNVDIFSKIADIEASRSSYSIFVENCGLVSILSSLVLHLAMKYPPQKILFLFHHHYVLSSLLNQDIQVVHLIDQIDLWIYHVNAPLHNK